MAPDLSVIIPVYNEAVLIVDSLQQIRLVMEKSGLRYELIVVNDGSVDNSLDLIENERKSDSAMRVVNHPKNLGYSEAIRSGLKKAKGEYVTYIDADLQNDPQDIIRFYKKSKESDTPFICGQSDKSQYPAYRKIISRCHNIIVSGLFGLKINVDINGIKLIKRSILNDFCFSRRPEAIGLELIIHTRKKKYEILPVLVMIRNRLKGESSFHFRLIFSSLKAMFSIYLKR